jgi:hypothetical protein
MREYMITLIGYRDGATPTPYAMLPVFAVDKAGAEQVAATLANGCDYTVKPVRAPRKDRR